MAIAIVEGLAARLTAQRKSTGWLRERVECASAVALDYRLLHGTHANNTTCRVDYPLSLPRHPGMSRPGNDLIPLQWNDGIIAAILRSERHVRCLRDILMPRDLKWLSGYVSTKAPHSPALWWHQDWWCWDHPISFRRSTTQVAVLCYLTDTDARNGALRILPGSHHTSTMIHGRLPEPHGAHANGLPAEHVAMADCPGQVTLASIEESTNSAPEE